MQNKLFDLVGDRASISHSLVLIKAGYLTVSHGVTTSIPTRQGRDKAQADGRGESRRFVRHQPKC